MLASFSNKSNAKKKNVNYCNWTFAVVGQGVSTSTVSPVSVSIMAVLCDPKLEVLQPTETNGSFMIFDCEDDRSARTSALRLSGRFLSGHISKNMTTQKTCKLQKKKNSERDVKM